MTVFSLSEEDMNDLVILSKRYSYVTYAMDENGKGYYRPWWPGDPDDNDEQQLAFNKLRNLYDRQNKDGLYFHLKQLPLEIRQTLGSILQHMNDEEIVY